MLRLRAGTGARKLNDVQVLDAGQLNPEAGVLICSATGAQSTTAM
ncbi:MAG: hypothetical protein ACJ74J_11925 [Blastocatellia bacterium]